MYGEIAIETDFAKVSCVLSEWCGLVLFLRHLHMHFGFSGPEIGPIFWARKRARIGSFQKEFPLGVPEKGPFLGPAFWFSEAWVFVLLGGSLCRHLRSVRAVGSRLFCSGLRKADNSFVIPPKY